MKKNIFISILFIAAFAVLMIYGLNHSSQFNPSQLVGKPAPIFTAPLAGGGNFFSSKEYEKKLWTVVNFWTSSCYVCRNEAAELERFYKETKAEKPQKINFISINIQDSAQDIFDWQKNYGQTFPVVSDQKGLISVNFGVTGTPETFFIDPQGTVRCRVAGELNQKTILTFINWLTAHPHSTQEEAQHGLSQLYLTNS